MRIFINTIIVLSVLFSTKLLASPSSDLSGLLSSIHTLSAGFTQTVQDNHGRQIQQAKGKMALSRPGKFRWEVFKPAAQVIIANGPKLWIYDPDLQQVTIRKLNQAGSDTPGLLMSNESLSLDKNYSVKALPQQDGLRWFKLTPKSKEAGFEAVQFGFSNGTVQQMIMQDNLGHTTKIQYNNVKTNITLSDSLFSFKAPAGVDVMDETQKR